MSGPTRYREVVLTSWAALLLANCYCRPLLPTTADCSCRLPTATADCY